MHGIFRPDQVHPLPTNEVLLSTAPIQRIRTIRQMQSLRATPYALALVWLVAACPALAVSPQTPSGNATEGTHAASFVNQSADAIRTATNRGHRARAAIALCTWVRKHPQLVSDADMPILASLLAEDDDIVRREAAGALGLLGARAKPFIPQLLTALKERPCSSQPAMSADAIHVALERIGYGRMGFPCTDPARSAPEAR